MQIVIFMLISVVLILVTPPWRCNQATERIINGVTTASVYVQKTSIKYFFLPTYKLLCVIGRALKYLILLEWLPPLIEKLKSIWFGIVNFVKTRIVYPIIALVTRICQAIKSAVVWTLLTLKYIFFLEWLPPLIAKLKQCWTNFTEYVHTEWIIPTKEFFLRITEAIKQGTLWTLRTLKYYLLLEWLPPLIHQMLAAWHCFTAYVDECCVQPTYLFICRTLRTIKYYLFLEWLPPLVERLNRYYIEFCNDVKGSTLRFCAYLNNDIIQPFFASLTYVFLLKWLPPLIEWIEVKLVAPGYRALVIGRDWLVYILLCRWLPRLLVYLRVQVSGVLSSYSTNM